MDSRLEQRYVVYKLSELTREQKLIMRGMTDGLGMKSIDCVVIESHWPEYDRVVNLLCKRIDNDVQQTIDD